MTWKQKARSHRKPWTLTSTPCQPLEDMLVFPRNHLDLSTDHLMGKFMFILSPLVTASYSVQKRKKVVVSISFALILLPHQSHVNPLHQFLLCAPIPFLPHWIIYCIFLLHHSFSAPLLSRHTLISWSERCFLWSVRGKTGRSDGSLWSCFTLSSLLCENGVGLGKGSSRGCVDLIVWVLGDVGLQREARYMSLEWWYATAAG